MEYIPSSWDQAEIWTWPPLTLVYLDLHFNEFLSVTQEADNMYLEIWHNNLSSLLAFFLAVWVCLEQGPENMVLVVLLQIGAKDLTVKCPYFTLSNIKLCSSLRCFNNEWYSNKLSFESISRNYFFKLVERQFCPSFNHSWIKKNITVWYEALAANLIS